MSTKRIEQLIEDIYEFVESCKPTGFKSNKVAVPKDELYDLLDELRLKVPDEIKRCPLKFRECSRDCAWFDDDTGRCAVFSINNRI